MIGPRWLLGAAVALLSIASGSCLSLDSFFYSNTPTDAYVLTDPPNWPSERHVPQDLREPIALTPQDGSTVYGVAAWRPAGERASAPTVVYSHGNSGNLQDYWDRVSWLWSLGANVIIYDYPGFGRTQGTPSEQGVYAAARAAYAYVRALGAQIDQSRVFSYGWSLGGAPATELAFENRCAGLILEAAFSSVAALSADGSLVVPASFIMTNRFDNLSKIRQAARNARLGVLIFHGDADDFVQTKYGYELDAAIAMDPPAGMHQLVIVPGANHDNVPYVADMHNGLYSSTVRGFLEEP